MGISAFARKRLNTAKIACLVTALVTLLTGVIFVLQVRTAQANTQDFYYYFDGTSREQLLENDFTESTEGDEIGYTTSGFIDYEEDDQGALNTENLDSLWTTKRVFAPMSIEETYSISGYFRNYSNNGIGAIGFTTGSVNELGEEWYPAPETGFGLAFHGSGAVVTADGEDVDIQSWDGELSDRWYRVSIYIFMNEDRLYDIYYEISEADEYGQTEDQVFSYSVNNLPSEVFGDAEGVYAYFAVSGARFDRVDNIKLEASKFPLPPPTGIRSFKDEETGDVFLGGDYIELGLSRLGSFGTSGDGDLPEGFFGTADRENIGMSTNPSGFGVSPDLRMDYFMPGSEEERWTVGYKLGGDINIGSNALLGGSPDDDEDDEHLYGDDAGEDIADNVVTNESNGTTLKARSIGTFRETIETTQVISFEHTNKFFRNEVTLKNTSGSSVDSVRYMRSFDPDNTVDQGGEFETQNSIPYTHEGGDGKAVVIADTSWNDEDPVFQENNSRSPILYYSDDARARVSTFGFSNGNPYKPVAYDEALPKGTSVKEDQAVSIAFDVGTLAPGESKTVVYYISLDNRDFEDVLQDIEENALGFAVDKNGDGVPDSTQAHVTSSVSDITGRVVVLEVDEACEINTALVKAEATHIVQDVGFDYPNGLLNFTVNCGDPGYTTTVKQYYFGVESANVVGRKYNSTNKTYFSIPEAVVGTAEVYGNKAATLTYTVKDGGTLDIDGIEDGTIVDPAGLGMSAVGVPKTGMGGSKVFRLGTLPLSTHGQDIQ